MAGNLLRRAPDEIVPIIEECVRLSDDDLKVGDLVQQRLVRRITERFLPLYESSGGTAGFISIQGAPEQDADAQHILAGGPRRPRDQPERNAQDSGHRGRLGRVRDTGGGGLSRRS